MASYKSNCVVTCIAMLSRSKPPISITFSAICLKYFCVKYFLFYFNKSRLNYYLFIFKIKRISLTILIVSKVLKHYLTVSMFSFPTFRPLCNPHFNHFPSTSKLLKNSPEILDHCFLTRWKSYSFPMFENQFCFLLKLLS